MPDDDLLTLIAKGGSIVGANESDASRANTALTQARVPVEQAQVPLIQAQTAGQQAAAQRTQLENQQIQQNIDAAKKMAEIFSGSAAPSPTPVGTPPTGTPTVGATPGFIPGAGGPPAGVRPANPLDPNTALQTFLRAGYPYPLAQQYATAALTYGKDALLLSEDQRKAAEAVQEHVGQRVANIETLPVEQRGPAWQAALPELQRLDPSTNWASINPADTNSLEQLKANHLLHGTILNWAKTEGETKKEVAQAGEAEAKTKQLGTEEELARHKIDLYNTLKSSPEALAQRVAGSIDPKKYPDEYARALSEAQNQPDLEGINKAIEKHSQNVSEREKTIAVESSPEVMKARQNQAIAIEQATNPLKLEQARAVAGATAGQREALKLDQDYVKSASATEALGRVLDETASGNKAAGAALPTVSAATFNHINDLRRLTRQEVTGVGGEEAGNLFDRVEGFFQKAVVGTTKIPQNIQDDMRKLHQDLGEQAYKQYTTGLDALSKRTGTPYQPTVAAPNIRKAAPAGGHTIELNGKHYRYNGSGDTADMKNYTEVK